MIAALLAAAAAASAPPPSPAPPAKPAITAETEITVTLPIGVIEAAMLAIHKVYTGQDADPVLQKMKAEETAAIAKLSDPPAQATKPAAQSPKK